jgi:hypothetical protein
MYLLNASSHQLLNFHYPPSSLQVSCWWEGHDPQARGDGQGPGREKSTMQI